MNERVLVIEGYDARMYVERGHLVTRDGFANEGKIREDAFPAWSLLDRADRGPGAGRYCLDGGHRLVRRMGIAISFVASDSTLLNCLVPDAPHDGPVKRAQAVSRGHGRRREPGAVSPGRKWTPRSPP